MLSIVTHLSQREEERRLLKAVLRLWIASRMESRSDRICGKEQLGMQPQYYEDCCHNPADNSSNCQLVIPPPSSESVDYNNGLILIPPVLSAQLEVIVTASILQPQRKLVLKLLNELFDSDRRQSWFTVYLTVFVLLHSCAMLIAADHAKAVKQGFKVSPSGVWNWQDRC